jgi:hypothetical protein
LLREQDLLRDFKEEYRSDFRTTREKRIAASVERYLRGNAIRDRPGLCFVRSTIFFFARSILRDCSSAAHGPLHVSHLILGR